MANTKATAAPQTAVTAQQEAVISTFETAYGSVTLTPDVVNRYLKRGGGNLTDSEITLFINLCKYQGLNPFVNEAYMIKFGDTAQMVVGYDAYKRRAYENPNYKSRKSGIVVLRGNDVIQKEGACLYPQETLLGGWCRVFYTRNGVDCEEYREVSLEEFDKGTANWKSMKCTMIEKVAVSQCLRSAFPKDFSGLYTPEEMGSASEDGQQGVHQAHDNGQRPPEPQGTELVNKDQRVALFDRVKQIYGENGPEVLKQILDSMGIAATTDLTVEKYRNIMDDLAKALPQEQEQPQEIQGEGNVQ